MKKTYVGNYTPANYAETKWQPFPNGRRKRREILTDELTGQKYEKYYDEVQEINNSPLKEDKNSDSQQLDESFDDEYIENGKTPQFKDYPTATEEELQDTSSARFLMYDGLAKLLDSKKMQGWLLLFMLHSKIFIVVFYIFQAVLASFEGSVKLPRQSFPITLVCLANYCTLFSRMQLNSLL